MFEPRGLEPVVSIERADVRARSMPNAEISGGRQTAVVVATNDTSMGGFYRGEMLLGLFVRRPIVHDDNLVVSIGLCEAALDCLLHERAMIEARNDYGHVGVGRHGTVGELERSG